MSDPKGSPHTWTQFLSDLWKTLPVGSIELTLPDERAFRNAFVKVCADAGEIGTNRDRLLNRFLRRHDPILNFVHRLDEVLKLDDTLCLKLLFYTVALATARAAFRRKRKEHLFRFLTNFETAFPDFGTELTLFIDDAEVQRPLQLAFKEYIACYREMPGLFFSKSVDPAFPEYRDRVTSLAGSTLTCRAEWERELRNAKEEFARRAITYPSFPNNSVGPDYPLPTQVTFEWVDTLGEGTFGKVWKVRQSGTQTFYAQKLISVADAAKRPYIERMFENEVRIMRKLRHDHIAAVVIDYRQRDRQGQEVLVMIIHPLADYDLLSFLTQTFPCSGGAPESTESYHQSRAKDRENLNSWFGCLVSALTYAHNQKIKHEDVKPSNILIKDGRPYLTDFGAAEDFSELENSTSGDQLVCGTPVYWPPEKPPHGRSGDVFSLGCVFSEMLTVRQGRTLESYRNFRRVPNNEYGLAFRENLPKVMEWVVDLKRPNDPIGEVIVDQVLEMLKEVDRPYISEVKKSFRREAEDLFCLSCQ